jgi:PAS domain S-box-containing protein
MSEPNVEDKLWQKLFQIKTIIFASLISIVMLHLLSALPALYRSFMLYRQAEQVNYLTDVSDDLFTAVGNYGFERGRVNVVLNDAGPVSKMEKNRQFILKRRSEGNSALSNALSKLNTVNLEKIEPKIVRIQELRRKIDELRNQATVNMKVPKKDRDNRLSEIWFSAMTDYIELIEDLLVAISIDISDADGVISRYASLKHEILALRNTAGPEMSILSATMLSGKPLKPKLAKKIEAFQNSTNLHFKRIDFLLEKSPGVQVMDALKDLKKTYFKDYLPYREAVFPAARVGKSYPYSQPEFLGQGVKALKQIARFMEVVVSATKNYAEMRLAESKRQILFQLSSVIGSLLLMILIFFYVHYRVINPMARLTSVVRRFAKKDFSVQVPFKDSKDEIGEMARNVEVFKEMALKLDEEMAALQKAEEKIKISEERFRTVADFAYDWEYWIDPAGNLKYISPSCERITGYSQKEFVNDNGLLTRICLSEYRAIFEDHISHSNIQSGPAASIDFKIRRKDGETRWINHTCQPILGMDGNFLGRRACNRDITDRKKLEEELIRAKKLEATATLAGGIAHDFNNLLSGILGNIELAEDSFSVNEKAAHYLKNAKMSSLRARDLTAKFITFSSGGFPVKESSNVIDFIKDSAALAVTGTSVKINFLLPRDPWLVAIDRVQLSQAINNIILNAKEAMPDGGILQIQVENLESSDLEESVASFLPESKYVRITFKDQGEGIPNDILNRVFDPYFSTKERGVEKGMGLGLTVVHSIMKKHKGYVSIHSNDEGGTAVCLYLPVVVRKEVLTKKPVPEFAPKVDKRVKKVLIMDDEEIVRDVVCEMLQREGHKCWQAKDGQEAIDRYESELESGKPFDIVVMDLTIPGGMGGVKAVKALLRIDSNAKVVVASGYSTDPVMDNYHEYGFCAAIGKPFSKKNLLDIIATT